ncbi:hypothetical protein [Tsukamurella paurometabola]|uniref:Uncharacterized protein n=1 Tax=Tsukamurella paurometabola TaxID=2061 RepID=A0A3P8JY33_TSUPA|nr:hypothetical protein [Tsukamurella paurometabola]MBS4102533.1 hypothetical protein [Tsukamurella paurometabola]UEA81242.1 hypothetical protein LK411_12520 [Tsukamurella paurometabola]VDR38219.1 Uncharacterised protein [Tsukamurella paurometabola]
MIAEPRALVSAGWILTGLVLANCAFWLRSTMLGVDDFTETLPWMFGLVLAGLWVSYLVVWFRRTKHSSWRLLPIPVIGALTIALWVTDTPQRLQWAYDEPRLTAAAQQVLADPRVDFTDHGDRRIGTLRIHRTTKQGGNVAFAIPPTDSTTGISHLEFRPDGSRPAVDSVAVAHRLSPQWWRVIGF